MLDLASRHRMTRGMTGGMTRGPALAVALLAGMAPIHAFAVDSTTVPQQAPTLQAGQAPARVVAPDAAKKGVVRIYRDSVAWFDEDRDTNTWISLGKTVGTDLFIHPLSDLAQGIPQGTAVVEIASNGYGLTSASATQSSRAAQRSLRDYAKGGGVVIVDMGNNDQTNGYRAPGTRGTPELVFPEPCGDATFTPYAKGRDGVAGTADDHPLLRGPDRKAGTADDLDDARIDMPDSCYIAHGYLAGAVKLPRNAKVFLTATFNGEAQPILAEYEYGRGRVIVDTVTKEFGGQNPPGNGPSYLLSSLFSYALRLGIAKQR